MKTFRLSILLALSAAASISASAQTRPATSTAARTTAKPATTTAKPAGSTASKTTATKPAGTVSKTTTTTSKPAPKPAPAVMEEEAAPVKATAAKPAAKPQPTSGHEFGVGSTALNLGVGFGLGYGYGLFNDIRATPALSIAVDRGITDNVGPGVISVGGLAGYKSYSWGSGGYKASWKNFIVAARGAYHYNVFQNPKVDTYAGLSLGVRVESYSTNYDAYSGSYGGASLMSGIFLGGRYMFTDNIGAFGELGYDMSLLKVGLTARF